MFYSILLGEKHGRFVSYLKLFENYLIYLFIILNTGGFQWFVWVCYHGYTCQNMNFLLDKTMTLTLKMY